MGTCYQLFPKLIYGAAAVTYSPQKLEEAFQSIWNKLLPSLCVNRNITKDYRMLPLWYQGLALPNPNINALSKKIHLLQSHWDTGSTPGRMLHQAYQVFQVEVGLGGNIFSQSFVSFGSLPPMGSSETSGNSCIDTELYFISIPTLTFLYSVNMTAH
jgi:hypothetical protein